MDRLHNKIFTPLEVVLYLKLIEAQIDNKNISKTKIKEDIKLLCSNIQDVYGE